MGKLLGFPHISMDETMDSGWRRMNPIAMTIINPQKEYRPSRGSNQGPCVHKFFTATDSATRAWLLLINAVPAASRRSIVTARR